MIVRPAVYADIPRIVELGQEMWAESPEFSARPFIPKRVGLQVGWYIDKHIALVLEHEGEVVGGFLGAVGEQMFNEELQSADFALFIHKNQRGGRGGMQLIKAYIECAKAKGCTRIVIGSTTRINTDRTVKLYERMGFTEVGRLLSINAPQGEN